jgi:MFS family permease
MRRKQNAFRFNLRINKVIQYLIYSDLIILTGWGLVNPIFSVYVLEKIPGADISMAGIAATIFYVSKSVTQLPVARFIDKHKGESDDFYILLLGSVLGSICTFLFVFMNSIGILIALQVLFGVSAALMYAPWNSIFTKHIDKNKEAMEWSFYDTTNDIGIALSAALGALIALEYGYEIIFVTAGISSVIGTLFILMLAKDLRKPRKEAVSIKP